MPPALQSSRAAPITSVSPHRSQDLADPTTGTEELGKELG